MNNADTFFMYEPTIRLSAFFGVFAVMALLELLVPRRALTVSKSLRWFSNLGLVALNTIVARLILPVAPVAFASLCAAKGWGVLNLWVGPTGFEIVIAVIILDFAIWLQHIMVHAIPMLWRLHRLHHADLDYDVTTGARFHPIEILLSLGIKFAVIALIGASPLAVLSFEVILNAMAMFNHANVRLPLNVDAVLRLVLVTPDFHRVHHSVIPFETNSNFGFNLSIWDRLLGTYTAQPTGGHEDMTIGLDVFREPVEERLDKLITQPFRDPSDDHGFAHHGYTINRRDWDQ
jgi:sterol desaturase/sphingolipid hydroxylase (fatty acid hydroxylase superfamily)